MRMMRRGRGRRMRTRMRMTMGTVMGMEDGGWRMEDGG